MLAQLTDLLESQNERIETIEQQIGDPDVEELHAETTSDAGLRREIAAVRKSGIAYDDGEYNAEARCVAVPVRDFSGEVRVAIGISGAVWRLSLQALEEKSRFVREAADRMSAQFGFVAGPPQEAIPAAKRRGANGRNR